MRRRHTERGASAWRRSARGVTLGSTTAGELWCRESWMSGGAQVLQRGGSQVGFEYRMRPRMDIADARIGFFVTDEPNHPHDWPCPVPSWTLRPPPPSTVPGCRPFSSSRLSSVRLRSASSKPAITSGCVGLAPVCRRSRKSLLVAVNRLVTVRSRTGMCHGFRRRPSEPLARVDQTLAGRTSRSWDGHGPVAGG